MPVLLGFHLFELKGAFGKRIVGVMGALADVQDIDAMLKILATIDKRSHTIGQIFDADHTAGKKHLVHAAKLALTAQATHMNFADSLNIELVCWVSGMRQIVRAFDRVGVRKGCNHVAVLTIGKSREEVKRAQTETLRELNLDRDDKVLDVNSKKISTLMKAFDVSEKELEIAPIEELVLEKVALLSLQR
jgi:tRNA threonylcarbamoyladenosine modification (KEOPS) complex Cgi121 subunit